MSGELRASNDESIPVNFFVSPPLKLVAKKAMQNAKTEVAPSSYVKSGAT